jgi:hypothetical protein
MSKWTYSIIPLSTETFLNNFQIIEELFSETFGNGIEIDSFETDD